MSNKSCLVIYGVFFIVNVVFSDKIIETTHGKVKGKVLKTLLKDVEYYGFMGIPYAQPPVKELRFLRPRPVDPWPGILTATKEKKACVQYNNNVKKVRSLGTYGREDCLYLDIYTPLLEPASRPVLVFLHNEYLKYSYNKTEDYAPDFFIEEDVVIATITHRLSVFGFLSFEDNTLQGNSGLWDIVVGLEWLKNNAERFGGDPNRITLMGSQGGAVAVDLLMHSEARKLFNSVILQGGSAWSSMYLQDGARQRAIQLGKEFEIGSGNSNLLRELNEIPAKDLLEKELKAVPDDYNKEHQRGLLAFGPTVERSPGALVTDYPENSTRIDIPVMVGFNSREGLEKAMQYLVDPKYLSFLEKDFVLLFPERVNFKFDPNDNYYEDAVSEVKKLYFPRGKVTIKNAPEFVTYMGDIFGKPINDMVKFYTNISSSPVYYYYFDYYSDLNENKNDIMRLSEVEEGTWGAASGDELCYLFKCPRLKDKYLWYNRKESEEIQLVRKLVRMWTNFAKYGNPTPEGDSILAGLHWPQYSLDNKEHLHIANQILVKKDLGKKRFQFWDDFVNKWRKKAVNGVVAHPRKIDEL